MANQLLTQLKKYEPSHLRLGRAQQTSVNVFLSLKSYMIHVRIAKMIKKVVTLTVVGFVDQQIIDLFMIQDTPRPSPAVSLSAFLRRGPSQPCSLRYHPGRRL